MTDAQIEIFKKVEELLIEHWDCCALIVESRDINDAGDTETNAFYHGSVSQTLGLMEHERIRLQRKIMEKDAD